jgi:hypothetical protein
MPTTSIIPRRFVRRLVSPLASLCLLGGLGSVQAGPTTPYFQGWETGSPDSSSGLTYLNNWTSSAGATLTFENNGANGSSRYLGVFSNNAGATLDPGAVIAWPLSGDYSTPDGSEWTVSLDLKLDRGTFDNVWLRYRFLNSSQNGWLLPLLTNFATGGGWAHIVVSFDAAWTDAEARAAGWKPDSEVLAANPGGTWSGMMNDVYTTEVRFSGTGTVQAGIDNFRLEAGRPQVQRVPEPGVPALLSLAGLAALLGWRRTRRSAGTRTRGQ